MSNATWKAAERLIRAAEKQQQREAKRRQRELERRAKEAAKLSALEQARLEAETYENSLEVLLSVHKECPDAQDWHGIASSLPPPTPERQRHDEYAARRRAMAAPSRPGREALLATAQSEDERAHREELESHVAELAEWESARTLAQGVLRGEPDAYLKAIVDLSPFAELATIGSNLQFTAHGPRLLEVVLRTNGRKAIPFEVKSLTASGKLSVKAMSKGRFVEVYQDYVCGCVLRVAREIFTLLPVQTLLVTATVEALDASTGREVERPFLSVLIPRARLEALDFDRLDPSDTVMGMRHRGDLAASRKTGEFGFIEPLTAADIQADAGQADDLTKLLADARRLRSELAETLGAAIPGQQLYAPAIDGDLE
jgi:hypothetical protein